MISFLKRSWFSVLLVALFAPGIAILSDAANANRVALAESYEDSDLEIHGKRLKGFALGAEGLLADWYWIRSLQYIGGKLVKNDLANLNIDDLRALNPRLLYPLLDNATDLDPHFIAAYFYGAVVLPAVDTDQAIKLTEKGIANNPETWRLYHYLGYIYWRKQDFESAARAYDQGSAIAASPQFMREMAAAMRTRGGSRDTAYELYSQILAGATDPQSKTNAELRLMQLDSMEELDVVNEILASMVRNGTACPANLSPVFPRLDGKSLPRGKEFHVDQQRQLIDPSGVPYVIDRESCKAVVDGINSKIPKQ
jgi:tetratricopeptide (TPR) repeat protein